MRWRVAPEAVFDYCITAILLCEEDYCYTAAMGNGNVFRCNRVENSCSSVGIVPKRDQEKPISASCGNVAGFSGSCPCLPAISEITDRWSAENSGSRLDQVTPRLLVTSCKDDGKINMKRECAADSHNWTPLCDEEAMSGCDEEAISGDESEDDESEYDYVPVESPSDKLQLMLQQLARGEVPSIPDLQKAIHIAASAVAKKDETARDEKRFHNVGDLEVRDWLYSTFTRSDSSQDISYKPKGKSITKFKAVVNTIIISKFLGRMECNFDTALSLPPGLSDYLETHLDTWEFDMFHTNTLSQHSPLRFVGYELFWRHNLFDKCEIPVASFDAFMFKIQEGYGNYGNPYHNACHGADVAQTVHYLINTTGLKVLFSSLEVLAMLLAALVHDVDHSGTNNAFLVHQQSQWALLYHDKSVLENHHLKVTFDLLQQSTTNFLVNVSAEDYRTIRSLVIGMVLATDMADHMVLLKRMKTQMSTAEGGQLLLDKDRQDVFNSLLHLADISHPGKPWQLHQEWSARITEEFYRQGDQERRMGLAISPLCDRNNCNIAISQIKFAEIIVSPMFDMAGQLIELLLTTAQEQDYEIDRTVCVRVWDKHLEENKAKWKERSKKEAKSIFDQLKTNKVARKRSLEVSPCSIYGLGGRKGSFDSALRVRHKSLVMNKYQSCMNAFEIPKITFNMTRNASEEMASS